MDGLKAVEKVPPEGFFLHHVFEISVGRCDQAEIAGGFLRGAHGADALFLKYAQKDLLQRKGKLPHFIKEQRPAVCFGDQAVFTCNRTGEGAAHMPEQQAFGKVLGKGRTVHDDEGTVLAAAVFVDGSRENLLARPRFPAEQNADIAVGTLAHGFQATADGRTRSDKPVSLQGGCPLAGRGELGTTAVLMIKERLLQSRENGVERVVLADEVPCPCHKCLFQPVTVVVSRDHDDFRVPFAA